MIVLNISHPIRFILKNIWLAAFLIFFPWDVSGQISVTITPPPTVGVGAALEKVSQAQVQAYINSTLQTMDVQAAQVIGGSLAKPQLFGGMSQSVALPLLFLSRPPWDGSRFSLAFGTWAGVEVDTLDLGTLGSRAENLEPNQDYRLGASAVPVSVSVSYLVIPGEWGVSVGAFGGCSRWDVSPVSFTAWAVGGSGSVTWHQWTLSAGAGWVENLCATSVKVTLPDQQVSMTLADLLSDVVTISASPQVGLTLDNRALVFPVQVSTGWSWYRTWNLDLAAGVVFSQGWSSVALSGTNPVTLTSASGVLNQFMGNTAWVTVSGSVGGSSGFRADPFAGFTPSWSLGSFRVGLPVVWCFPGGFAGGLTWGLKF